MIVIGLTRSVLAEPAACETDTVFVSPPPYAIVIVALRAAEVFAVTLTVMVAFPVPGFGLHLATRRCQRYSMCNLKKLKML